MPYPQVSAVQKFLLSKNRRMYSIQKKNVLEIVTGRPECYPPEGPNRPQTLKNFQMPRTPAYSHLNTPFPQSLEKVFSLRNNTLQYPKVYSQTDILKKVTKLSLQTISHGCRSSTMTNVNSVTGLFRCAALTSQQPHQMALSRSTQEQLSWARKQEKETREKTQKQNNSQGSFS